MAPGAYRFRVPWGETDAAGIVFYPNYARWFDQATHEFFRELGYPMHDVHRRGYGLPARETTVRYRRSARYDDELLVTTVVEEVRIRGFRLGHTVLRGEELLAEGHEVRVWVRFQPDGELDPEALPDDLRGLLTAEIG